MNEQHNLDNILREKLADAQRTPPDHIWDGIESRLKSNKSNPWVPLLLIATVIMLIAVGVVYFSTTDNSSADANGVKTETESVISDNTRGSTQQKDISGRSRVNDSSDEIDTEGDSPNKTINSSVNATGKGSSERKVAGSNSSPTANAMNPVSVEEKSAEVGQTTSQLIKSRKDKKTSSSRGKHSKNSRVGIDKMPEKVSYSSAKSNKNLRSLSVAEGNASDSGNSTTSDKITSSEDKSEMKKSAEETHPQNAVIRNTATKDKKAAQSRRMHDQSLENLSFDKEYPSLSFLSTDDDKLYKTPCAYLKPGLCKKYLRERQLSAFAEARVGIGIGSRFIDINNPRYKELAVNKEELESAVHNEAYSLRVGLLWQKGVSISTGIELHRQWEKYRYEDKYAVIQEPIIAYDTVMVGGEEEIREDTISPVTIGKYTHQNYNKITSVDIPIILAYEQPIGNWIVSVNGGVFLNITQKVEGKFAGLNKKPQPIGEDNLQYSYKSAMGLGFYGGLGVSYYMGDGWEIGIHPRLRYNPSSLMTDESVISQRYMQFDVSLGVRRYF